MNTSELELRIDSNGWCENATHCLSPNYNERPTGVVPSLLVIHNITLPPHEFGTGDITKLFTNTLDSSTHPFYESLIDVRVSAHFVIQRDGLIVQYVSTENRAWHAGLSCFEGIAGCNDFSIGIEMEGTDFVPFEEIQYQQLAILTTALAKRYPLDGAAGHEHIAPGRKTDPGPCFDWSRYKADIERHGLNLRVVTDTQPQCGTQQP